MKDGAPWRTAAIVRGGGLLLDALLGSCRFRVAGTEHYRRYWDAGEPVVFVLWHGRLLPCTYHHRELGLTTLISQHRDGDYIAGIVRGWGYHPVRGSSSRNATGALRELVRSVRNGSSVAITPDGPRGPRGELKPGAVALAQLTGAPLIPASCSADRAWWFGGWDRFLVPQPFARCTVGFGPPVEVPRDASPSRLEQLRRETQERLHTLTRSLDGAAGQA